MGLTKSEAWLVIGVLVAIVFSGCSGDPEKEAGQDADEPTDGTGSGANSTADRVTAQITVSVDGNETSAVNGSIPLVAGTNVTFDGTKSIGANLTYAWDFGDNGTGTNATEVYVFAAPGLFNVSLTVAGGNTTNSTSVSVNVTAGGPAPGAFAGTDSKSFTGSLTFGNPNACSPSPANMDCKDHKFAIMAAAPDGTPAIAKVVRVRMTTSSASATQMTICLLSTTNACLKSASNAPPAAASPLTITHEAEMPPGDYGARVRLNAGANVAYTVTVEVDYFAT